MVEAGVEHVEERLVEVPPKEVFHALTEEDALERWWPTRATTEPRAGGAFVYDFTFVDGEHDLVREGTYREVEPFSRVTFEWHAEPLGSVTRVTFELEPVEVGTRVRLKREALTSDPGARELQEAPWAFLMDNLKSVLEEDVDRRREQLGMRVK